MTRARIILLSLLVLFGLGSSTAAFSTKSCADCRYNAVVTSVYDGDTFDIAWPSLPAELTPLRVRVRGIDTPEMKGKCASEIAKAKQAKALTVQYLNGVGNQVTLGNIGWDNYGGRIDADVYLGANKSSLAGLLVQAGVARVYLGGKRQGWC
jgi:micrococcal nuclease